MSALVEKGKGTPAQMLLQTERVSMVAVQLFQTPKTALNPPDGIPTLCTYKPSTFPCVWTLES